MASIVCQVLQSYLEPQVTESLVLPQSLSPPPKSEPTRFPLQPKLEEINGEEDNNGGGRRRGWSFLKALEKSSSHDKTAEVYVHPMVKRSASALSSKSLEMCTESLGSETGSDVSESGDEFCPLSWGERERVRAIQMSKYRIFDRKVRRGDFPPPLTSISGSDGTVKVRHHREGGRLVIKAVCVSKSSTNFQTERTNGRLRLSLSKDSCASDGGGWVKTESENEYVTSDDDDEEEEEEEEGVAEEEEEEEGGGWGWDMDGNGWKVGWKRLTRCKEGGNGNKVFANWGSFWVAIS